MKFTRSTYPDYPNGSGDPCWNLSGRWLWIDVDWNPRFPFGACFGASLGPQDSPRPYSFCLDVNAPLGEPNRLYLNGRRWYAILGLWPGHGCDRYKYHRTADGTWERGARPAPLHWGWLTVDRRQ